MEHSREDDAVHQHVDIVLGGGRLDLLAVVEVEVYEAHALRAATMHHRTHMFAQGKTPKTVISRLVAKREA